MGGADFALEVYYDYNEQKNVLRGGLAVGTASPEYALGTTSLTANTWYLIQINTRMYSGWGGATPRLLFGLEMDVYLGGALELSVGPTAVDADKAVNSPLVNLGGEENDGFDEIRHLDRELYASEATEYAAFLKQGRVAGKSKGELGYVGW